METRLAERHQNGATTTLGGFATAQDAWAAVLSRLKEDGEVAPGSRTPFRWARASEPGRGGRVRSWPPPSASSTRGAGSSLPGARRIDLGYAIANVLWTIAGSNTLREISCYNPVGESFSDDGLTLFGARRDTGFSARRPVTSFRTCGADDRA